MEIAVAKMIVTPQMANDWLTKNTSFKNRSLRDSHVHAMAADIKEGRFHLTHQGIAIVDGYPIDGQHRLSAIVRANKSVEMFVFFYASDGSEQDEERLKVAVSMFDGGRIRSLADRTKIAHGWGSPKIMAAARIICGIEKRQYGLSYQDVLDVALRERESLDIVAKSGGSFLSTPIYAAFVYCLQFDANVTTMLHKLYTGAGLEEGQPILLLRNQIRAFAGGKEIVTYGSDQERMSEFYKGIYVIQSELRCSRSKILKTPTKDQYHGLVDWLIQNRLRLGLSCPKKITGK